MSPDLSALISGILFVADSPVSVATLMEILQREKDTADVTETEVQTTIREMKTRYQEDIYPFEIQAISGGYQLLTKRSLYPWVRHVANVNHKKKLTRAALETLAIIAYRQPATKAEVEFIRGVNSDYAVQKLLERNLISIAGRADAPGKPLLYATSPYFMQFFGLNDPSELPKLKEFQLSEEDHLNMFKQQQTAEEDR